MSDNPQSPGRIIGLVLIIVVSGLVVLEGLLGGIHRIPDTFVSNWNGHADLLTPNHPFGGSDGKSDMAAYSGVTISSDDALVVPRALQAADITLSTAIRILGGLLVGIIAIRLLAGKTVARLARWGLTALGILIMVKANVGPQLQVLSVNYAVQDLGYPIVEGGFSGTQIPEAITPGLLGVWAIGPDDTLLFLIGAIVAVVGFLFADGIRVQRWALSRSDVRVGESI